VYHNDNISRDISCENTERQAFIGENTDYSFKVGSAIAEI